MSDPYEFTANTARFGLPLLWTAQAQKEEFVNEAHALIDGLMHCAIEGVATVPPANPVDGECWLVGIGATGAWTGHENAIAIRQSGNWLFVLPRDGMRIFNRTDNRDSRFASGWHWASRPAAPSGGATIDTEARTALAQVVQALESAGIIAPPAP